jgi:hypothetical protein
MMVVLRLDIFGQAVSEWLPRTAYSQHCTYVSIHKHDGIHTSLASAAIGNAVMDWLLEPSPQQYTSTTLQDKRHVMAWASFLSLPFLNAKPHQASKAAIVEIISLRKHLHLLSCEEVSRPPRQPMHFMIVPQHGAALPTTNTASRCFTQHALFRLPSWPNHIRSILHRRKTYRPRPRFRYFMDLPVELREIIYKYALKDILGRIYVHSPTHHGHRISNLLTCRSAVCWVNKNEGALATRVLVSNARFFMYMDGDAEALKGWIDRVLGHGVCHTVRHLEISNAWSHRPDGLSKDIEFMRNCLTLRTVSRWPVFLTFHARELIRGVGQNHPV